MKLLENKVVLITGASRGIGRGIALTLAQHGAHIAFTYLSSPEKGMELENTLKSHGVKAKGYQSDASQFNASEQLINQVLADFEKIDILVNNAGITRDNLLMRMTEEQFDEVLRTNLKSCFNTTPGFIETEMTGALDPATVKGWTDVIPMKRGGTVDDIANAVLFFASDLSTYITGQVLHVNGGMYT